MVYREVYRDGQISYKTSSVESSTFSHYLHALKSKPKTNSKTF